MGQEDPLRLPHQNPLPPTIPLLVAITVWTAVVMMAILVVSDLTVIWLDPERRKST